MSLGLSLLIVITCDVAWMLNYRYDDVTLVG